VRIRPDCARLPWLTAVVGIAGLAAGFFLQRPSSWSWSDAWQLYLAVSVISGLLLVLAYLDWRCHRETSIASMPPESTIRLLAHLAEKDGWTGPPTEFNKHASRLLYGASFSELLANPTDYYSSLMSDGLIEIMSVTDHGNRPDGTPDTTVSVLLTPKAQRVLYEAQSNKIRISSERRDESSELMHGSRSREL